MSARFRRTVSSSESLPIRLPSFALGTVVTLSTISRETFSSPFASLGLDDENGRAGRRSDRS